MKQEKIEFTHEGELVEIEPSKMVNIPSSAIHIENDITLLQKKLWFELVYKAFPMMGKQKKYTIKLNELRELLGWEEKTSNDTELKQALYALNKTAIQWNIFGKDKRNSWQSFPLLAGCDIPDNSGVCIFAFSPFLEERFLAMGEEAYVKIDLIISNKFQSKYALSIYCLALDYLMIKIGSSEKNFSLEQLRRYLAIREGEYKKISHFNERIIQPAEKEINEISDMDIKIEPFKEGRKINGYKFSMSLKEGKKEEYLQRRNKLKELPAPAIETNGIEPKKDTFFKKEEIIFTNKELKEFFARYNISVLTDTFQDKIQAVQEAFGNNITNIEKYLLYLSKYSENEYKNGSIKNLAGFYVSLFKDDKQMENYFHELDKELKQNQKRKQQLESQIETKIQEKYKASQYNEFHEYIVSNVDSLEAKIIEILSTLKSGLVYEVLINDKNKGIIDKTLITNQPKSMRLFVINELRPFETELGYIPETFENWKTRIITKEYIESIQAEIEKVLR